MGASKQKWAGKAVGGRGCRTYCDCTGLDCGSDCVGSDDGKEHVCSGCKVAAAAAAAAAAEVSTCFLRLNALPVHVELQARQQREDHEHHTQQPPQHSEPAGEQ